MNKVKPKKIKVASFFSGIGGFDLGFERAGMEVVFQSEINKYCQKVLKKHWPNVKLNENIITLTAGEIPDADVWCGGFPCQDLSLANQGKRKGLNGDRSGLFYKYAELIQEKKPKWVIIENVPGLLNSHNGRDFQILLEKLDELGYGVSWKVFDAKYFGTPQRRRRVFIIASFGDLSSAEVLFDTNPIKIVYRSGLGERDITSPKTQIGIGNSDFYSIQHATINRKPEAGPQAKGYRNDEQTYTLDSRGSSDVVCSTNDAFRIRETPGISSGMDSNRFRAIGNAVAVDVVEWIGKRIVAFENQKLASKKSAKKSTSKKKLS
jgi:DNA (cytosine-5)-methyltransferase 1